MAGILGTADLAADTDTTLFTASGAVACNLNLCNRGSAAVAVRVALAAAATPTDAEYIEYGAIIPANGVLERTGLVLDNGKLLIVRTDTATVSAVAYGM